MLVAPSVVPQALLFREAFASAYWEKATHVLHNCNMLEAEPLESLFANFLSGA